MASTRVEVDLSLFTSAAALGRISGPLEFLAVPRVGETLSFLFNSKGVIASPSISEHLQPKIATVIHKPEPQGTVMLMLEDIVLESSDVGVQLAEYLQAGFDLFFDRYGDDAL